MKNKKILIFLILIIALSFAFLFYKKSTYTNTPAPVNKEAQKQTINPQDKPQIVSTKPDPLEDSIISAADIVEITFNRPLENVGEFKVRIEPQIEYRVELSGDRKTAKIMPAKPYSLGTTYSISIGPESKFDGVGRWGEEKTFHFRTIKYTGV